MQSKCETMQWARAELGTNLMGCKSVLNSLLQQLQNSTSAQVPYIGISIV
jgi:hypothetical protein